MKHQVWCSVQHTNVIIRGNLPSKYQISIHRVRSQTLFARVGRLLRLLQVCHDIAVLFDVVASLGIVVT
jgi:hypothetical protein